MSARTDVLVVWLVEAIIIHAGDSRRLGGGRVYHFSVALASLSECLSVQPCSKWKMDGVKHRFVWCLPVCLSVPSHNRTAVAIHRVSTLIRYRQYQTC